MRHFFALIALFAFALATTGMARASISPGVATTGMADCHHNLSGHAGKMGDCCAGGMAGCAICCVLGVTIPASVAPPALAPAIFTPGALVARVGVAAPPALPPPRVGDPNT